MGLFNKDKKVSRLTNEVEDLKSKLETSEALRINAERSENRIYSEMRDMETEHIVKLANVRREVRVELNEVQAELKELKENNATVLENHKIDLDNQYVDKTNKLEKEHAERMRKLEKDFANKEANLEAKYLEKMTKCDKKLEDDKASFRRYMKTEHNKYVELLETDNKNLLKENLTLRAERDAAIASHKIIEGTLSSVAGSFDKLIGALPAVSAEITTPEVVVQMPKQEVPAKGGNNGGEKK